MSDLRIDGPRLSEVSARITAAVSAVRFNGALSAQARGVLGSSAVATALRDGAIQQDARADSVADALARVGAAPALAVASFAEADAGLARVF